MKRENKEQKHQFKAMRRLELACRYGSMRNKIAARCAMHSDLPPVDAWKLFKEAAANAGSNGPSGVAAKVRVD